MDKPTIEFRKEREFGDVLNATFAFIGQEFKLLMKAMLYFAIPIVILMWVVLGWLMLKLTAFSSDPTFIQQNPGLFIRQIFSIYGIIFLIALLGQNMILTTVNSYILLYNIKGKGNFSLSDIWSTIGHNFFRTLGGTFVIGLITVIGFMLCFIPGIYLGVSLSFFWTAMIIEGKNFGDSFSRSFILTHTSWWWTFLLIFVIFMIIMVISFILIIPMYIVGIVTALTEIQNTSNPSFGHFGIFMIVYAFITTIITNFLYVIPYTAFAFQYYSLVERKEKSGLADKVNQIV